MGATNFYMGSLRYSPCGRKRKNHALNSVKKSKPVFKPMTIEVSTLDQMRAQQEKQYKSIMEEYMQTKEYPTSNTNKKESPVYTGTLVKGIATMHKSNAVPVISQQEAEDISNMRRN
jgi:hypothetical protein|tara:strand:+ start:5902 stop:6252 length:351 start_codon:yes stop_codon:yes gene_type:complete